MLYFNILFFLIPQLSVMRAFICCLEETNQ